MGEVEVDVKEAPELDRCCVVRGSYGLDRYSKLLRVHQAMPLGQEGIALIIGPGMQVCRNVMHMRVEGEGEECA